jgi:membrane-bound lytic murein transglycosylase B
MRIIYALTGLFLSLQSLAVMAEIKQQTIVDSFIAKMQSEHQFKAEELTQLFKAVESKDSILRAISKPAEGSMPWYKYRKIFMTDSRISGGVEFWHQNELTLSTVAQQYGVPAEIIVAILGVETRYGKHTGRYRVIDALSTLGFGYPKRSNFFLKELENFLLLCREENMDPLKPLGSYAGAMGLPQFMPSSFRHYAVDHDGDSMRDIWNNSADVIASIASYFSRHHWQPGQLVSIPTQAIGEKYKSALSEGLKPNLTVQQLQSLQLSTSVDLPPEMPARLLEYEREEGSELWITLNNFYVITRYNHSAMYAMAVYQLSQAILDKKDSTQ